MAGIIGRADGFLTQGAMRTTLGLNTVAQKGGLLGKAAGFLSKGVAWFGKLTPMGKALTIGASVVGLNAIANRQPAAQRVA